MIGLGFREQGEVRAEKGKRGLDNHCQEYQHYSCRVPEYQYTVVYHNMLVFAQNLVRVDQAPKLAWFKGVGMSG